MSPFQALSTAVAAQVGTGNIVGGVATAIASGGPGLHLDDNICLLGMATILANQY